MVRVNEGLRFVDPAQTRMRFHFMAMSDLYFYKEIYILVSFSLHLFKDNLQSFM